MGMSIFVVIVVDDDVGFYGYVMYKLLGKGKKGECLYLNFDYIVFIKMLKFFILFFW